MFNFRRRIVSGYRDLVNRFFLLAPRPNEPTGQPGERGTMREGVMAGKEPLRKEISGDARPQAMSLAFSPAFIAAASSAKTAAVRINDKAEPNG